MKRVALPLIYVLCVLLVLARGLGLHAHHELSRSQDAALFGAATHAHVHWHHALGLGSGDHSAAHAHDEVDADSPDKTTGKLQFTLALALLPAIIALLFLPRPLPRYSIVRRQHRRRRPWTYFKPLSHAPPLSG